MDDAFRKLIADQDMIRRHTDLLRSMQDQVAPAVQALKAFGENSAITKMVEDAKRSQEMMRSVLGPMEDLRRSGLLETAGFAAARQAYQDFEKRFHLPAIDEVARLFRQFEDSGALSAMRQMQEQTAGVRKALEAMRVPWLDAQNSLRSIGGFVELQRIGLSLRALPFFDFKLTDSLRLDLGDWRVAIDWPHDIFTDLAARTAFYAGRGLDTRLTDFPTLAFEQGTLVAGLRGSPPALIEAYRPADDGEEDPQEADFERTNDAHDRLQRFESQLRRFIDERMRAACGEHWIKHRVPGDMRQRWIEKKQKAMDSGEKEWPLIAYADFTDYVPIITKKDNWRDVFEPVFRRSEFVMESFQRLYPIRICTMHARLITQDDELYLYVETKRILGAIGVSV